MSLWSGTRSQETEWLDEPGRVGPGEAAALARTLRRLNGLPGGWRLSRRYLDPLLRRAARARPGEPVRLCDVGTGAGDFAVRMARWAERRGIPLQVLAVESDPELAALAREASTGTPGVHVVEADARVVLEAAARGGAARTHGGQPVPAGMPAAASRFDVIFCGLMMHHYGPEEVTGWLRLFAAASSTGWVVQDLERSRVGAWASLACTHLFRVHPVLRRDGPLSFRRAYTEQEWRRLVRDGAAGGRARVRRHWPWRIAVHGVPAGR